ELRNPRLQLQEKSKFRAAPAPESLCKGKAIIISKNERKIHMNSIIHRKRAIPRLLTALALACFALLPVAQALPPPKPEDRGNGNSAAENVSALNLSTTGGGNTAHGWYSLFS